MTRLLLLLLLFSLFSLLILQGASALCVPRANHFKTSSNSTAPSLSSSPATSPGHVPTKPPEPEKAPVSAPHKPSPPVASPPNGPAQSPNSTAKTPGSGPSEVNTSVINLCKKTDKPDICVSAVQPYLPDSGNVGPKELLTMQIKAGVAKLAGANSHADQLLSSISITPYVRSCLETCKDVYDDANSNFADAARALTMMDLDTLKTMLSAALSDASTCDDGFSEMPGLPLLMGTFDDELMQIAGNCLALADLL